MRIETSAAHFAATELAAAALEADRKAANGLAWFSPFGLDHNANGVPLARAETGAWFTVPTGHVLRLSHPGGCNRREATWYFPVGTRVRILWKGDSRSQSVFEVEQP